MLLMKLELLCYSIQLTKTFIETFNSDVILVQLFLVAICVIYKTRLRFKSLIASGICLKYKFSKILNSLLFLLWSRSLDLFLISYFLMWLICRLDIFISYNSLVLPSNQSLRLLIKGQGNIKNFHSAFFCFVIEWQNRYSSLHVE